MLNRLLITILLSVASYATCVSIDSTNHQCRYKDGDNWCTSQSNNEHFAYKDTCLDSMDENTTYSFVASCGSGCALTYKYYGIREELSKYFFKVVLSGDQYLNENKVDHFHVYNFIECKNGHLISMFEDEQKSKNTMDELMPSSAISFQEFGEYFCSELAKEK